MKIRKNIKSTLRIAKIELNSMFYSPVAWLIIIIFACQIGYSFFDIFDSQLHAQDLRSGALWQITSRIFTGMMGVLSPILRNLYLYIPLITMGLMSREYSSGSIKLLYSSPINNASIIMGKFLSMMVYGIVLLGILIFITIFCQIFIKDFEYGILLTSLLGFYLLILAYSAIGIFMSSLTPYQVVAAIGTLALLAGLNYVGSIGQDIDFVRDITYWLSISNRSYPFLDGLISSEDVIYYIVVISFFISLSVFKLNTEKTVMSISKKIMGYSSIVLVVILLGYITSRPQMKFYYDATSNKENTLSEESQSIIKRVKKAKGDLKIVSYVNILSNHYYWGIPSNRIDDAKRFEKYSRFMPGITMEYVLYYDKANDPSFTAQRFAKSDMKETAKLVCKSDDIDFETVLSPEEFKKQHYDLKSEGNKFLRKIVAPDGSYFFIRTFNDNEAHPGEAEISATMAGFIAEYSTVGFYSPNENREMDNYGDRGFYLFSHDKWFRSSLLNSRFNPKRVDLDKEDLTGIDILVLSDLNVPLTDEAMAKIKEFYDKGGRMFISGDYQRSENMNKLSELFGVKFSDGLVVEESAYHSPTIIATNFTEEAAKKYKTYEKLQRYNYKVSANTAVALDYTKAADHGFKVTPVLKTTPNAWIEYETTDFIDGVFTCNKEAGEEKGERTILLTLERMVGDKEQRIVISGDADIISNGELTANHPNINAQNYAIINGSFRWLSDDVYPVDVAKPGTTDDEIYLPKGSRKYVKALFLFIIPISLLAFALLLIIKRQRK